MNYITEVFKKYIVFSGRARRKEYWYFELFLISFSVVVNIISYIVGNPSVASSLGVVSLLFTLVTLIPSLSVLVRRLHDIGKSGWWFFINFIPLVGFIWFIVLMCTDSDPGENMYGPNPKGIAEVK